MAKTWAVICDDVVSNIVVADQEWVDENPSDCEYVEITLADYVIIGDGYDPEVGFPERNNYEDQFETDKFDEAWLEHMRDKGYDTYN